MISETGEHGAEAALKNESDRRLCEILLVSGGKKGSEGTRRQGIRCTLNEAKGDRRGKRLEGIEFIPLRKDGDKQQSGSYGKALSNASGKPANGATTGVPGMDWRKG